ncbi:MAG: DsbA family protein, partial [Pseudomonadota bacterium]|nr:DsbA family protein [Pseudomonadota bacterium]
EARLGVNFDWRPLTLDIESYLGSARKSEGQVVESNRSQLQWLMVKYAYMDARRYAGLRGLVLKGTEKIWDSSLAGISMQWICKFHRDRLPDYLNMVFPRFWRRELNIESIDVLESCVRELDIDLQGYRDYCLDQGKVEHDELQASLHPAGIFGVPSYVINERILFGREHLPVIEWMLTGENGPTPYMSNPI